MPAVPFLRGIEHRIESAVEGLFGRAFRSHVQPVELARKLAKEMDDHKSVSVSRVYVPNEYVLYLSPSDREQFAGYEESLLTELADYLSEHARREGYSLLSPPRLMLEEDEDLDVGEFGIATRMVQAQRPRGAGPPEPVPAPRGETKMYKATPAVTAAVSAGEADELGLAHETRAFLRSGGKRHEVRSSPLVIGRSRECDITLDDPNVSRRHAELRPEEGTYWIVDLDSTNGIEVNGKRVQRAKLDHEDVIVVGKTELVFEHAA
jgi:Protein of unknown function (DUF3662)/FHA domain